MSHDGIWWTLACLEEVERRGMATVCKKRSRVFLPDFKLQPDAQTLLISVHRGILGNGLHCLNNSGGNFVGIR